MNKSFYQNVIIVLFLHVKMAHLGHERVCELAKVRFYWPNCESDIKHFVTKLCTCIKDKRPNRNERAPLVKHLHN